MTQVKHWSECATEAEEAQWWDDNPEYVSELLRRRQSEGRVTKKGKSIVVTDTAPKARPQGVAIRVAGEDVRTAKQLAARKGLPYQTYLRMILHDALRREWDRTRRRLA